MRFFDVAGQPIVDSLPGMMRIELEQLRQTPCCIGASDGAEKKTILEEVRSGASNVLISDKTAVSRILELINE